MTDQDREWVKAMIAQTAQEVFYQSKDFTEKCVRDHSGDCPRLRELKRLIVGVFIGGSLVGGIGFPALGQLIMKLMGA